MAAISEKGWVACGQCGAGFFICSWIVFVSMIYPENLSELTLSRMLFSKVQQTTVLLRKTLAAGI